MVVAAHERHCLFRKAVSLFIKGITSRKFCVIRRPAKCPSWWMRRPWYGTRWPSASTRRKTSRSITAGHSITAYGRRRAPSVRRCMAVFAALRGECGMNVARKPAAIDLSSAVQADVARIKTIWNDCLAQQGGPFLYGGFSIADAFYAPVVIRFDRYRLLDEGMSRCAITSNVCWLCRRCRSGWLQAARRPNGWRSSSTDERPPALVPRCAIPSFRLSSGAGQALRGCHAQLLERPGCGPFRRR